MSGKQPLTAHPIIFGEVLFDVFSGDRRVLGGAPFNVAWHLEGFSLSPLLISRIGDDACGKKVMQAMHDWGMDTSFIQTDATHATGEVHIEVTDGEPTFDIVDGRAYDYIETVPDIPSETDGLALLYHGTLAARHHPTREALRDLRQRADTRIFLDINLRDPWWEREAVEAMLADAHWVKLNHHELLRLCEAPPDIDEGDIETLSPLAMDFLKQHNVGELWLTCGGSGAAVFTQKGERAWAQAQPVPKVTDTVGAGDGFTAIVILGLYNGWNAEETLERAQTFAAAICGMSGATIPAPEIYQQFSRQWGITHA